MTEEHSDLKILCVDDDEGIRELTGEWVKGLGFAPLLAASATEAMALLERHAPDTVLIVSDLQMPEEDGLALRQKVLARYREIPFAILSGVVTRELALRGIELKITAFLDKPGDESAFAELVSRECGPRLNQIRERQMLTRTFIEESRQILDELEPLILSLEANPGDLGTINGIFRLIHTIKGSSGVIECESLTRFAHKFEDLLSVFKKGERTLTPADVTLLLRGNDALKSVITLVEQGATDKIELPKLLQVLAPAAGDGGAPAAVPSALQGAGPGKATSGRDGVRVATATLDEFMELSGEITVFKNMVNKLVRSIEKAQPGNRDVGLLAELLDEMHKINGAMQGKIVDLRKVPLSSVYRPLPRTVRDLCNALGKEIVLITQGEELRVDTAISQALSDSLIHLIRNSADHGLEMPEARVSAGKGRRGTVRVSSQEEREHIVVQVQDDGRGIDVERIRGKLIDSGSMSAADANRLVEAQLLQKIFDSGFSTAAKVSDVSGRGVGMDMVRSTVERLGGRIDVATRKGLGTTFTLRIPVPKSVLIINSLLTCTGQQTFAIAQDAVDRLFRLSGEQVKDMIEELPGGMVLKLGDQVLPLINLRSLIGEPSVEGVRWRETGLSMVTLRGAGQLVGLIVDEILDSEEIVVKPIGEHLTPIGLYSGATFLGDGSVGLILDVDGMVRKVAGIQEVDADGASEGESELTSAAGSVGATPMAAAGEYLLLSLPRPGMFAVPTADVYRIEEFGVDQVQFSGSQSVTIYRGGIMRLLDLNACLKFGDPANLDGNAKQTVVVTKMGEAHFGFQVARIIDIVNSSSEVDQGLADRLGIRGTVFIGDIVANVVDLPAILTDLGFVPKAAANSPGDSAYSAAELPDTGEAPLNMAAGWGLFD